LKPHGGHDWMKHDSRILGAGVLLAVLFWVADAAIDAWVFSQGSFQDLLIFDIPPHELYVRGLVVLALLVGSVVSARAIARKRDAWDRAWKVEARLRRTNQILKTLRQLTRLVQTAGTRKELLGQACSLLLEDRRFEDAWIVLLRDGRPQPPIHSADDEARFGAMTDRISGGWIPPCAEQALEKGRVHLVSEPRKECGDCPLRPDHEGLAALTTPLVSVERAYGWLTVSLPREFGRDPDEQELLTELAGEIGLGLSNLEGTEKQRKLEESYAAVLETTAEAVISASVDGSVILFNPGAERLFGYAEGETLGQPISILTPPELADEQDAIWRSALKEDTVRVETARLAKDGRRVPVSMTLNVQRSPSGEAVAVTAILHDISHRIEREEEYAQLIDTAPDGFLVVNMDGEVLLGNDAISRLLGYPTEELPGLKVHEIDAEDSAEEVAKRFEAIRRAGALRFETRHRRRDGSLLEVEVSASYLSSGPPRIISFVRDIGERKRAENTIRESRERFQMLFDNMAAGVAIYEAIEDGEDFLIRDMNASGAELARISRDTAVGMRLTEVFPGIRELGLLEVIQEVWRTGEPRDHPLSLYRDNRVEQWVENYVSRLPSGLVVAVFEDTSEQRRHEEALRESEERFREMAELLPEAVFEADASLRLTYANRRAFELFGYTQADFREGIHALDTLRKEDRARAEESFRRRLKGEEPGMAEYTATRKDGSSFPILFHASLISREGRSAGLRGIIVDLTEQKAVREEIQASSRRFRNIVEASPMGIFLYQLRDDGSLILEGANRTADRILGIDCGRLLGKPLEEAFPALADTEIPHRYRRAAAEGVPWQSEQIVYEEGEVSGAFEIAAFQTSPGKMAVMFLDVTHRKEAREALERSEERLRMATRSGRVGVWEYEIESDDLQWDELMYELFGTTPQTAGEGIERWRRFLHPDDLDRAEQEFRASLEVAGEPFDTEFRIIREDTGEIRHIRGMAGVIRDSEGRPLRTIGTNWDVTEDRRAKEALRISEEKFRSVIEQSNDAVYILFENSFDLVNKRFCELTGVTQEEATSQDFDFWDLIAEGSRPLVRDRQEKRSRGVEVPDLYEFEILRRGGQTVHVEASVTEIDYRGGKAVLGILRDITEHKNLQTQLNQAQKMESIGRLSGGVAHDLNNLLTPIIGYAELIRDDLGPDDERRESADEIVRAGFRSRDLVRQLLAFSRQQTLEFKTTDLNRLVLGFEKLLRRTIREDIEILINPGSDVPTIRGDRGQLEQVLMNLAVNAQDAMPEGGTLHIETSSAEFDEAFARSRPGVTPGSYALLSLTDTGIGMDVETRERIFEPFFTTKEKGRGTGLGLATVYGIVKQHGGNIWVYSEPESGTTFKCYFPVADPDLERAPREANVDSENTGSETIMVVEDEELVRNLAVSILKRKGYEVLSAEDPQECLVLLESRPKPVDLLLTDVVLPGMNGRELFQEVSSRFPTSRVLYMSGYSDDVVTHRGVLEEGISFIQKPFSVQALAQKVREVLTDS